MAEDQLRQVVDRVVPVALQVTQTEVDPPQVVHPPVAVSIDLLVVDLQPLAQLPRGVGALRFQRLQRLLAPPPDL